jgi:hypothetical protein
VLTFRAVNSLLSFAVKLRELLVQRQLAITEIIKTIRQLGTAVIQKRPIGFVELEEHKQRR